MTAALITALAVITALYAMCLCRICAISDQEALYQREIDNEQAKALSKE